MRFTKKQRVLSYVVGGIYLLLLIWLVLFKFSIDFRELSYIRSINLIPFHYETEANVSFHVEEVLYNILIFIPFGVYLSIFKPGWSFPQKILPGLCLSFSFEVIQYIAAIGSSDITDLIGNTMGVIIGIGLYRGICKIFKKSHVAVINVIGLSIEIMAILLLGVLLIAN